MQPGFFAGINLPVLMGAYNHDLAPNQAYHDWGHEFGPLLGCRYLSICRVLGFAAVRIWLCENREGIRTDRQDHIVGTAPELLDAVACLQEGAAVAGLQLYWSLLDGNSFSQNGDRLTRRIASDPDQAARFAERVVSPLAAAMDPQVTFAVETVSEPENLSRQVLPEAGVPWERITQSVRTMRDALHAGLSGVPVTCGVEPAYLPGLLGGAKAGSDAPVDAVDLHFYHPDGGLPSREDLPVDIGDLPLWAGECGLSHRHGQKSPRYLLHYLYNARELGYRAAFLWKLEGAEHLVERRPESLHQKDLFEPTDLGGEVQHLLREEWS